MITAKNFGSMQPKVHTWRDMLNDIANGDFDRVFELTPRNIAEGSFVCTCCSDDNVFIRLSRVNTEDGMQLKVKAYSFESDRDGNTRTTPRPAIMEELESEPMKGLLERGVESIAVGIAEFAGKQELGENDVKFDLQNSRLAVKGIGEFDVFVNDADGWSFQLISAAAPGNAYLQAKGDTLRTETFKQLMPLMFQSQYAFVADTLEQNSGISVGYFRNTDDLQNTIAAFREIAITGDFTDYLRNTPTETALNQIMQASNALTEIKDMLYPSQPFGVMPHKINLCSECLDIMVFAAMEQENSRCSLESLIADAGSHTCNTSAQKKYSLDR